MSNRNRYKNLYRKEKSEKCLIFVRLKNQNIVKYFCDSGQVSNLIDICFISNLNQYNWHRNEKDFSFFKEHKLNEINQFIIIDYIDKIIYTHKIFHSYFWNKFSMSFIKDDRDSNKKIIDKKTYKKFFILFNENKISDVSLIKSRSSYKLTDCEKQYIIDEIKNCKNKKNIKIKLDSLINSYGFNFYVKNSFEFKEISSDDNKSINDLYYACLNFLQSKSSIPTPIKNIDLNKKIKKNKQLLDLEFKEQCEDL